MRRRNESILLWLSEKEYAALKEDVAKSGLTTQSYLRALINGRPIKERPSMELIDVLRTLQQIGNNMNQIAAKANSLNFVDTADYWENVEMIEDVKQELLDVMYGE